MRGQAQRAAVPEARPAATGGALRRSLEALRRRRRPRSVALADGGGSVTTLAKAPPPVEPLGSGGAEDCWAACAECQCVVLGDDELEGDLPCCSAVSDTESVPRGRLVREDSSSSQASSLGAGPRDAGSLSWPCSAGSLEWARPTGDVWRRCLTADEVADRCMEIAVCTTKFAVDKARAATQARRRVSFGDVEEFDELGKPVAVRSLGDSVPGDGVTGDGGSSLARGGNSAWVHHADERPFCDCFDGVVGPCPGESEFRDIYDVVSQSCNVVSQQCSVVLQSCVLQSCDVVSQHCDVVSQHCDVVSRSCAAFVSKRCDVGFARSILSAIWPPDCDLGPRGQLCASR